MQLPRGTFREIRKKVRLGDLIAELERTRFTGTCGIVSGPATGSFVFLDGTCILAKFRGETGPAGWATMQQYAGDAVDVILATLDDAQIKLSLEFNAACRIRGTGAVISPHTQVRSQELTGNNPATRPFAPSMTPAGSSRGRPVITSEFPFTTSPQVIAPQQPASQVIIHKREEKSNVGNTGAPPASEPEDIESEFDALDSMDLDHVTAKIRSDCRTLVKHLQLEHLMDS